MTGWSCARRILAVRLDYMGDVLMTGPALRAFKEGHPETSLTLLTSPQGHEAARLLPELNEVMVYDAPWLKLTPERKDICQDEAMIAALRQRQFHAAAIFTVYSQNPLPSALLCYLAGIPLRAAYCHENPYQLLTDWLPDPEPGQMVRHEVRRQLDLVEALGFRPASEELALQLPEQALAEIGELLRRLGIDDGTGWAVVHAGASAPSRRYPAELWARVAAELQADGWRLLFTGSSDEAGLVESIIACAGGNQAVSLAGQLSLAGMAALIARAPLLLSGNTGPVHLAAAVGTPVVDLYALTNPQHTPWKVRSRVLNHDVPCKNCYKSVCPEGHHDCLRLVTPEEVAAAARELANPP